MINASSVLVDSAMGLLSCYDILRLKIYIVGGRTLPFA